MSAVGEAPLAGQSCQRSPYPVANAAVAAIGRFNQPFRSVATTTVTIPSTRLAAISCGMRSMLATAEQAQGRGRSDCSALPVSD